MQRELQLIHGSSSQKYITITDSHNTRIISGGGNKGGIVAHANQIINIDISYNTGNISCFYESSKTYGGIVETGNIPVDQCYNIGTIKSVSENTELGGFAGRVSSSEASLENCYNVGEIKYEENISSSYIGGICGEGI